jgi:hypothetical protein
MTINPYEQRLISALLLKSSIPNMNNYPLAKKEWKLESISEGVGTCACGKTPIKQLCLLRNTLSGFSLIVGSTCVEKYLEIDCKYLYKDIELAKKNKFVSNKTLEFAIESLVINTWEFNFYNDLRKLSRLSEKQKALLMKINNNILKLIKEL